MHYVKKYWFACVLALVITALLFYKFFDQSNITNIIINEYSTGIKFSADKVNPMTGEFARLQSNYKHDIVKSNNDLFHPIYSLVIQTDKTSDPSITVIKLKKQGFGTWQIIDFPQFYTLYGYSYEDSLKLAKKQDIQNINPNPEKIIPLVNPDQETRNKTKEKTDQSKLENTYYKNLFTNPELNDSKIEQNSVEAYLRIQQRLQDVTFQKRANNLLPTNYGIDFTKYNDARANLNIWLLSTSPENLTQFKTQMNIFYTTHPDYKIAPIQTQEEWDSYTK